MNGVVEVKNNNDSLNADYADRCYSHLTVSLPDPDSWFTVQRGVLACRSPTSHSSTSAASKHIHPFSDRVAGAELWSPSLEASKLVSAISTCLMRVPDLLCETLSQKGLHPPSAASTPKSGSAPLISSLLLSAVGLNRTRAYRHRWHVGPFGSPPTCDGLCPAGFAGEAEELA